MKSWTHLPSRILLLATAASIGCSATDGTEDGTAGTAGALGTAGTLGAAGTLGKAGGGGAGASTSGAAGFANTAGANSAGANSAGANSAGANSAGAGAAGASAGGSGGAPAGGASTGGTSVGGTGGAGMSMGGKSGGGSSAGGASAGSTSTGGSTSSGGSGGAGTGGSGGSGGGTSCGVVPVDPSATPATKKLLCYLYSQYKNHVLSGQQETSWSNPTNDISFYVTNTGKYPAILGGDFLYVGTTPSSQGTTTSRAQAYWAAGGIPMIRYHMGAPPNSDSYENSMLGYSATQCGNVVTSGTSENNSLKSKLDSVATNLLTLQTAGVAVILALYHETQPNGWFWWSKCSNAQFLALYKYSYEYLMNTKGVHNFVRLMPFSGSPNSGVYPGKAQVDIVGPDTYATNPPFTSIYSSTASIAGSAMPIALHETGVIPQPSTMFPTAAPWLLWSVWAGYETSNNTVANIQSAYASTYTVTRDELPNLK